MYFMYSTMCVCVIRLLFAIWLKDSEKAINNLIDYFDLVVCPDFNWYRYHQPIRTKYINSGRFSIKEEEAPKTNTRIIILHITLVYATSCTQARYMHTISISISWKAIIFLLLCFFCTTISDVNSIRSIQISKKQFLNNVCFFLSLQSAVFAIK